MSAAKQRCATCVRVSSSSWRRHTRWPQRASRRPRRQQALSGSGATGGVGCPVEEMVQMPRKNTCGCLTQALRREGLFDSRWGVLGLAASRQKDVPTCQPGVVAPQARWWWPAQQLRLSELHFCGFCTVSSHCPAWFIEMSFQQTGVSSSLMVETQEAGCWQLPLCCGPEMAPVGVRLTEVWLQLKP